MKAHATFHPKLKTISYAFFQIGPFFRVEQLIFTSKEEGQQLLTFPILSQVLDVQLYIMGLNVSSPPHLQNTQPLKLFFVF